VPNAASEFINGNSKFVVSVTLLNHLSAQLCRTTQWKSWRGVQQANVGSDKWLHTLSPLGINHWPSLGPRLDPAAPGVLSEEEFGKWRDPVWTSRLHGRVFAPSHTSGSYSPCHNRSWLQFI